MKRGKRVGKSRDVIQGTVTIPRDVHLGGANQKKEIEKISSKKRLGKKKKEEVDRWADYSGKGGEKKKRHSEVPAKEGVP